MIVFPAVMRNVFIGIFQHFDATDISNTYFRNFSNFKSFNFIFEKYVKQKVNCALVNEFDQ